MECQVSQDHTVSRVRFSLHLLQQGRVWGRKGLGGRYLMLQLIKAGMAEHKYLLEQEEPREKDREELALQFHEWRSSLGVLGIPSSDLVKVFTAVVLLASITQPSLEDQSMAGKMARISRLLGVQQGVLVNCLTTQQVIIVLYSLVQWYTCRYLERSSPIVCCQVEETAWPPVCT